MIVFCIASFIAGFCFAAVISNNSYEKGFDDGWRSREIEDKHGVRQEDL